MAAKNRLMRDVAAASPHVREDAPMETCADIPLPSRPLRLEWIEAGSLTPNPGNRRRHSPEQSKTIRALLDDPEVGWAGACLFNERTGRLIDGHLRQKSSDPKEPIPVLVGNWSEAAEAKILATLDPVAAMATGDRAAFEALVAQVNADDIWTRDLIDATLNGCDLGDGDDSEDGQGASGPEIPDMELRPFEHYDYVVVLARTTVDWEALCESLQLERVNSSPMVGKTKIGLCRAVDAAKLLRIIRARAGADVPTADTRSESLANTPQVSASAVSAPEPVMA